MRGRQSALTTDQLGLPRFGTADIGAFERQVNEPASTGHYDGDGRLDLAVYRPSENRWYVLTYDGFILSQQFGLKGDLPTESAYMH